MHRGRQFGAELAVDHDTVTRRAEAPEQRGGASGELRAVVLEQRERAAQPPQADAQLVDMLRRMRAAGDLARVGEDLVGTAPQHGLPRRRGVHLRREPHRGRHARRRHPLAARQQVSALGLAAAVEPQAEARQPAACGLDHRDWMAGQQLDLELANLDRGRARRDVAGVERELDARLRPPGRTHDLRARTALDVSAVERLQRAARVRAEQREQPLADRRAGVQPWLDRRHRLARAARHVVLGAGQAVVAGALQGLHPLPALAAQAQREPGERERAFGGVVVRGLKARPRRRVSARDRRLDGCALRGGHLQLQFDFLHDDIVTADPTEFDESAGLSTR